MRLNPANATPRVIGGSIKKVEGERTQFFTDMQVGQKVYAVEVTQPVEDFLLLYKELHEAMKEMDRESALVFRCKYWPRVRAALDSLEKDGRAG